MMSDDITLFTHFNNTFSNLFVSYISKGNIFTTQKYSRTYQCYLKESEEMHSARKDENRIKIQRYFEME